MQKIVLELENAADHAKLGIRKQGLLKDYYLYEIGRRLRILYRLDYEHKIIEFVSLGDHKQVMERTDRYRCSQRDSDLGSKRALFIPDNVGLDRQFLS